jgi:S1-C subfamily serine protease
MPFLARLVIVGLLSLTLSGCILTRPYPVHSVQPLRGTVETFCTAFSINQTEGYWVTAKHCIEAGVVIQFLTGQTPTLAGHPYTVIHVDPIYDVAVIQSGVTAPALPLARRAPAVGDRITVEGFPLGVQTPVITRGYVAARNVPVDRLFPSDMLDVTTTGGNSGSPVMNEWGEVIGVLWGGSRDSEHSLSVPYGATKRTLEPYVEVVEWF